MSEKNLLILVVASVILIALFVLRKQLSRLIFKAGAEGFEAQLETREENEEKVQSSRRQRDKGITVRKNRQYGKGNVIEVESNLANVEENKQVGVEQRITAKDSKPSEK